MSKRRFSAQGAGWDAVLNAVSGAAKWLPLLLGAMFTMTYARAQTSGVPPLLSGDCAVSEPGCHYVRQDEWSGVCTVCDDGCDEREQRKQRYVECGSFAGDGCRCGGGFVSDGDV